jgi:hypothetical protein
VGRKIRQTLHNCDECTEGVTTMYVGNTKIKIKIVPEHSTVQDEKGVPLLGVVAE